MPVAVTTRESNPVSSIRIQPVSHILLTPRVRMPGNKSLYPGHRKQRYCYQDEVSTCFFRALSYVNLRERAEISSWSMWWQAKI